MQEFTDYELAQKDYRQARKTYEAQEANLNAFKNRYSPDPLGYRKRINDICSGSLDSFLQHPIHFPISEARRERHTYICGGTGSGKSEMMKTLTHHCLTKETDAAIIVFDPHGDLGHQVARFQENEKDDRVILIDPALSETHSPILNPFDVEQDLTSRQLDAAQQEITEQLGAVLGDGAQLSANMEVVLAPCIATLLRKPGATIADLQRFMNDERNNDLMQYAFAHLDNPSQVEFLKREFFIARKETKEAIRTRLQILLNSTVFRNLLVGESTINLEKAIEARKLIIFNVSRASCGKTTALAIGRLIMAQLLGIAARRGMMNEAERKQCAAIHLFVDESQNYSTTTVREILDEARKFKLYLTLANQYIGQFTDNLMRDSVEQNTLIKLTGLQTSEKTKNLMAKISGVEPDVLATLGQGKFVVKIGELPAYTIQNGDDLIDNRHGMEESSWQQLIQAQLNRYYRSINQDDPPVSPLPRKETEPQSSSPSRRPRRNISTVGPKYPINLPKSCQ